MDNILTAKPVGTTATTPEINPRVSNTCSCGQPLKSCERFCPWCGRKVVESLWGLLAHCQAAAKKPKAPGKWMVWAKQLKGMLVN